MTVPRGVWSVCPTALTADEQLDEDGQRAVVEHLVDGGVDGFWLLGSDGEGPRLEDAVWRRAVEVTLDALAGRLPAYVGVSAESTKRVLARAASVADLPLDGVFATPPYYYSSGQEDIVRHFRAIAAGIGKPVIIYNNPFEARVLIEPDTLKQLAQIDGIVGVKEASADFMFTQSLLHAVAGNDGFGVLQAYDQMAAASLLTGSCGLVSTVSAFAPALVVELHAAAARGDAAEAFAVQRRVDELVLRLGWTTEPDWVRGVKACLEVLGVCASHIAAPFAPIDDEERATTRSALDAVLDAPAQAR